MMHARLEADDAQPLIEVDDLLVQFGGQTILRDIGLSIPRGQTLALIGESGCGKTVLLKSLIGLVNPTHGDVIFDGQNIHHLNDRQLTKQRIRFGFVFQNAALFDSMTIGQNVAFPLKQHTNKPLSEIRDIVFHHLREVGLPESVVWKKPAELSGGMRKRVGLARALVLKPDVVLYDEPTTGLDPIMSDVINELILRTRSKYPVTSIVVTHDMRTAQKVADRMIMMYPAARLKDAEPQILYDGRPEEVEDCPDQRVTQFVRGEAGQRIEELGAFIGDQPEGAKVMDDRVLQFRVGFVMLVAMLLTGILFFLLGEQPQFLSKKETVYVVFETAPGVTIDTPVRTSGILIGRVSNVKLQDDRSVLVTLKVEKENMPHQNEVVRIVSESLLGDAALEFVPTAQPGLPNQPLPDGAKIKGMVQSNPFDVLVRLEDSLVSALTTIEQAGGNVSQFAQNANKLLEENGDGVGRIMTKTETALDRFDSALAAVQNLVGDQQLNEQLKTALQGLPETLTESRKLIDELRSVAGRADRNLENLEGFTEPLGERGEQLVANLENSTENLNILVAQLAQFGRKVNESDGTLGQLINDPHLYQNLNDAAANIRELTLRLRPIVEDARVFADKIARDPGRIGVKGALNRNQSGIK